MVAMMRSNDAYMGFTHDVFCFTMMQELIARSLGIRVGEYHHFATSLHLYETDTDKVSSYLSEGFQSPTFAMPSMPEGCQRANLDKFLRIEQDIRSGNISDAAGISLPAYWKDLSLILLRHADAKYKRGIRVLDSNFDHVSDRFYNNFFLKKPRVSSPTISRALTQVEFSLERDNAA